MVGTGLLLGTALGVIIPEGLEALVEAHPGSEIPSARIALSLLIGFTFMLLVEQVTSHGHHHHGYELPLSNSSNSRGGLGTSSVDFDAELDELENEQGVASQEGSTRKTRSRSISDEDLSGSGSGDPSQAFALTIGLVVHSLADGLALGVSFASEAGAATGLSIVVFLAIIIHKLPTSLALTTSLLATSLPRPDCKKHLAAFSVSTPVSTVATYFFITFFGGKGNPTWTGTALLLSGGTFLYVATLVSQHVSTHGDDISKPKRLAFIVLGMFIPFILSSLLGHGHD
ncbi:hypothetical protein V5O48_006671 [Marasmius crinis-equi]|uniref:Zinc/iron permease n=1 Tax=Marasmius crinis-equi TaxID=585013 RepID=A0ABR3FIU3_9AGAR